MARSKFWEGHLEDIRVSSLVTHVKHCFWRLGAEKWPQADKEYEYHEIRGNSTQLLHTKNMSLRDDAVKCSEVSKCIQWVFEIMRFLSVPAKEIRFYGYNFKSNILQSIDQLYIYIHTHTHTHIFCGKMRSS